MKKFKKVMISIISATAVMAVSVCSSFAFAKEVSAADNGVMRDITAVQMSKEMGLGLNLGNTMEAYWLDGNIRKSGWLENGRIDSGAQTIGANKTSNYETCWGAPVTTQAMITGMKDAGFNAVRIPVYWGNMMENDGTFTINKDYIARVKEIVDYCRTAGVYAVINMHHYDEFLIRRYSESGTLDDCAKTINKLWTQIAEYFKDYSDYLIFEGFNEYLGGGPYQRDANGDVLTDQWGNPKISDLPRSEAYKWANTLNQTFVDAVRATGGNNSKRVLIVSGYWTNIDLTTSSEFKVPTDTVDNKLMVSVHYVDNSMYWSNQIGSQRWMDYSIDQCEKLKSAFYDKGIPVFVGETTGGYQADKFAKNATVTTSSDALDYMLRLITSYGFTPVIWDTPNGFYNRNTYQIKSSTDAEVIKTLAAEIAVPDPGPDPDTYVISGMIKVSDSDSSVDMTVTVVSSDGKEVSESVKSMGEYSITGLKAGTYTLKISGGKYAPREYSVTIGSSNVAQDVTLNPYGDLNGDGKVTTADVGMANSHAKGVKPLEGYAFVCADVTGADNTVTTADVGKINSHAKGVKTLW